MPKRTRFSPELRRKKIMMAAIKLKRAHGDNFTLKDIAHLSNTNPRTVRHYFTMAEIRRQLEELSPSLFVKHKLEEPTT